MPILNEFADFIVDIDASKPTRMFSTSIFGGAAPEDREIAPIKTQTQTITEKRSRALPLVVFVLLSSVSFIPFADPCLQTLCCFGQPPVFAPAGSILRQTPPVEPAPGPVPTSPYICKIIRWAPRSVKLPADWGCEFRRPP